MFTRVNMVWMAVLSGCVGFVLAYIPGFHVNIKYSEYISLAALAGIDSIIGGVRAAQEGKFKGNVLVSGFITNTLLAAFLAYLGEELGQPLSMAAVVVLGWRIFVNLSIIRRVFMDRIDERATVRQA